MERGRILIIFWVNFDLVIFEVRFFGFLCFVGL